MVTRARQTKFTRKFTILPLPLQSFSVWLTFLVSSGVEPLTPDDIAEIVVFTATRRENVVLSDVAVFPSHQASALVMHRKT